MKALAVANIKPRLRMTTLYFFAQNFGFLVCGASNKDELEIGYFTKHGDSGVDMLPMGDLLKGEVRLLAEHLGVCLLYTSRSRPRAKFHQQPRLKAGKSRVCLLYTSLLVFAATGAFAAEVTLKLGHIADPQNPYAMGAEKFAELVKEKKMCIRDSP